MEQPTLPGLSCRVDPQGPPSGRRSIRAHLFLLPYRPALSMSFAHPQHSRTRPHQSQRTTRQWNDSDSELATSESADSEVLLFAPPPSSRSTATVTQRHAEWEVVSAFARPPSGTATSSSTASSSARDHQHSPASLSHSLFPSHDGNGIFTTSLSDSLVVSEAPSIYASAADLDGAYITPSDEDASVPSSEDRASYRPHNSVRRTSVAGTTTSSFSDLSHPSYSGSSSIGGSWALTSEALSALPDVSSSSTAHIARPSSAAFTSDSSEDESQGDIRDTPRRGERRRNARYDEQEDEDEDLLSRTPQAESAGIGAFMRRRKEAKDEESRSSREAYPSPPPERLAKVKRRHRQSGRTGGSQKRSSTSGSVGVEVRNRVERSARKPENRRRDVEEQRAKELRTDVEKEVFLGKFFGKVMDVDIATLHLIANADPTPTPSRSTSPSFPYPHPHPHSHSHSHSHQQFHSSSHSSPYYPRPRARVVHGFAALSHHARQELGPSHFHFGGDLDSEMYDLDEESGAETETEPAPWARPHESGGELGRSHSLSSLPRALFDGIVPRGDKPKTLRRTSSLSSRSGSGREGSGREGGMENAWGGEFEGLEAAMSYWRRILRRMRGY